MIGSELLDELLDQPRMSEQLRMSLAPIAAGSEPLTITAAHEIASATGRRRVVRYVVTGLDSSGPTTLIAKAFSESRRAKLLYDHLQALSTGPFAAGRFCVPQPLAFLPEHNLVLYRPGVGVPLSQLDDGAQASDGVRDAARWLARLHSSRVRLPRSFNVTQEISSAHEWADVIARHHPDLHGPAHQLAARWATAGSPAQAVTQVPIHKDYHAGHVLISHRICVIDLDEARHGDPAFDLAHFCTYLEWQGDHRGVLREAFLQEYGKRSGWADYGALTRYSAYSWLKIAKQLAVRSGPCRVAGEHRGWQASDAVARGMACLGR